MMEITKETIGKRLRVLRKKKKWSIRKAAEVGKIQYQHLHRYETGAIEPKLSTLWILLQNWKVSFATFIKTKTTDA